MRQRSKGMKDYKEKEKMPEEDMLSSQNNKGKRFCSEENKISALLYLPVHNVCIGKIFLATVQSSQPFSRVRT